MESGDVESLRNWFKADKRFLPWREKITPYGVWVSEVMLQQTQVAVVIPYYERWMARFPTILALAAADELEVLKYWEGLGYYARARRLHAGARQVVREWGGVLPSDAELLKTISGLGPYTIGAIRSFAFHCRAAAVDGNVLRVLARYYSFSGIIDKPASISLLRDYAEKLLPEEQPWVVAEALIELGATLCGKKAQCHLCPVRKGCSALQSDSVALFPKRRQPAPVEQLYRAVAVVRGPAGYLLKRVAEGRLMGGLCEFPYLELKAPPESAHELLSWVKHELECEPLSYEPLAIQRHSFTRYKATLYPYLIACKEDRVTKSYSWHTQEGLINTAFPSGHRSIAQQLTNLSPRH